MSDQWMVNAMLTLTLFTALLSTRGKGVSTPNRVRTSDPITLPPRAHRCCPRQQPPRSQCHRTDWRSTRHIDFNSRDALGLRWRLPQERLAHGSVSPVAG